MGRVANIERGAAVAVGSVSEALKQSGLAVTHAMSRREAIAAGGLAIAGAASLAATSSPRPGVLIGADRSGFAGLRHAAPLAVGLRWYFNRENELPNAWPRPFPGARMTLSLRPNPGDLLSGRLDRRLKAFIHSAPEHSELAFWHENVTMNPLGYPAHVHNARTSVRMQRYGLKLCRGTNVRFGVITVGPVTGQLDWIAPGLDWYGDDFYEFPKLRGPDNTFSKAKVVARLNQNHRAWRKASGTRSPTIRICETNSPYDAHRSELFAAIAEWLPNHNGNRMLTYWNAKEGLAQGGLSGAWPPGEGVIKRLHSLSKTFNWHKSLLSGCLIPLAEATSRMIAAESSGTSPRILVRQPRKTPIKADSTQPAVTRARERRHRPEQAQHRCDTDVHGTASARLRCCWTASLAAMEGLVAAEVAMLVG